MESDFDKNEMDGVARKHGFGASQNFKLPSLYIQLKKIDAIDLFAATEIIYRLDGNNFTLSGPISHPRMIFYQYVQFGIVMQGHSNRFPFTTERKLTELDIAVVTVVRLELLHCGANRFYTKDPSFRQIANEIMCGLANICPNVKDDA